VCLIDDNTVYTELVEEILDHQGIGYDKKRNADGSDYVAYIIPKKQKVVGVIHDERKKLIFAEEYINMNRILSYLQGKENNQTDIIEPYVNIQEKKLLDAIEEMFKDSSNKLIRKPFWPRNSPACCVLTHDVDWMEYSPFHRVVISRAGIIKAASLLVQGLAGKDFGWNIDEIVNLEKSHGLSSTFLFMSSYSNDSALVRALEFVREQGFEVSLHGSDGAHLFEETLLQQVKRLENLSGSKVKGVRHHILKMKIPESWEIACNVGLEYDATLSYNRLFGFRAGICYPFRPFSEYKRLNIIELPTSFMDFTALSRKMNVEQMKEKIQSLMKIVEMFNGVLVLNFHNTYLNKTTFPDISSFYEETLKELVRRKYWITSAGSCVSWWKRRNIEGLT
jgi:hypothetical protein